MMNQLTRRAFLRLCEILSIGLILAACGVAPTPTVTPAPTITALPTNTPLPTSTTTLTVTPTLAPTLTPTPMVKAPVYSATKYYVDANFDDGTFNQFSEWTRGLDRKWQSDTSKRVIIPDPTKGGIGRVAAFYLRGPGAAFDRKHRLDMMIDDTAPNFADFNPGPRGASVDFYFQSGHDSFTTRNDARNFTIFEARSVGHQLFEGEKDHITVKLHLESHNGQNVIVLYSTRRGTNNDLIKIAESKIPIQDGVWNNIIPLQIEDGKFFLWNNNVLDSDLSNIQLPDPMRVGLASGTMAGVYAGVDFVQKNGMEAYFDNVKFFQIATKK